MCSLRDLWRPGAEGLGLAALLLGAAALSAQTLQIKEYPLHSGRPVGITAGPDDALWFTNDLSGRIGRMTTEGVLTEYADPNTFGSPYGITLGPDGALWYAETQGGGDGNAGTIGRVTTAGVITEYLLPLPKPPFQQNYPLSITAGPDGALWFTMSNSQAVGRITTTGSITVYPVYRDPVLLTNLGQITLGPDNALWFTEPSIPAVGRINSNGVVTHYPVPFSAGGITAGPDGALWLDGVCQSGSRYAYVIVRLATSGAVTTYSEPGVPCTSSATIFGIPYGEIMSGPDGALWFTTGFAYSGAIGRITTDGIISKYTPSWTSFPTGLVIGPDGNIWFTDIGNAGVGVIVLVTGTPKPISLVVSLPGAENAANFVVQWSGTDPGGSGLRDYSVYVSDTSGPFKPWLWHTTATRSTFAGTTGHSYGFYCIARDWAGRQEDPKFAAEATTYVASAGIGDVNGDGQVNCADLAIVKASFGKRSGQTGFDARADVNHDGVVDVRDLSLVSQQLVPGTKCQ